MRKSSKSLPAPSNRKPSKRSVAPESADKPSKAASVVGSQPTNLSSNSLHPNTEPANHRDASGLASSYEEFSTSEGSPSEEDDDEGAGAYADVNGRKYAIEKRDKERRNSATNGTRPITMASFFP